MTPVFISHQRRLACGSFTGHVGLWVNILLGEHRVSVYMGRVPAFRCVIVVAPRLSTGK